MRLQSVNLLLYRGQVIRYAPQVTSGLGLAVTFLQLAQLLALVVQQLLQLALHERRLALPLAAAPAVRDFLNLGHLVVEFLQLLLEPHFFPVVRLGRAKVGAGRLEAAPTEPRQVLVAKLGLAAGARVLVGLGGPAGGGRSIALRVQLVVDLVALKR